MKTDFRATKFTAFLSFSALVIVFVSFSAHFDSERQGNKVCVVNNVVSSVSGNSETDANIDNERRALRLVERFNLMEETFGEDWTNTYDAINHPPFQCTIGIYTLFSVDLII
jgi:hypothetical protein